jgi:hypothetical protein
MKNILLLAAFVLVLFPSAVKAQTEIFSDNFDSYEVTTSVATLGYIMWECGATVKADIAANSGLNYASMAGTAAKSNYMRKRFEATAGHSYTFKVFTLAPTGTTHKIGAKSQTGTLVNVISPTNLNNNTWVEQSISFTAVNTENVEVFLYIWGANTLHSDDWKIIDNTVTTSVENTTSPAVKVLKSGDNQLSISGCDVVAVNLFDISGKLMQTANQNNFAINSSLKGIYIAKITDKTGTVYKHKIAL